MKAIIIAIYGIAGIAYSQASEPVIRLETGIVFSHFQQQVKQNVGDERGNRLVNEFHIGGVIAAGYRIVDALHVGLFSRLDRGERYQARFNGFDGEGRTQTTDGIGGVYTEIWIGPYAQFQWKQLLIDIGFAPFGRRYDMARGDLPNARGESDGSFSLHPAIAWMFSVGGEFEIGNRTRLLIKAEYRPRYYNERGGDALIGSVEHGTQSISPIIGLSYTP
jgi:hypothetical protein